MKSPLRSLVFALAALTALFVSASVMAQWAWTDKDGRRIFSDQAPASDVPEKSIFKRPAGTQVKAKAAEQAATAVAAASAPAGSASAPKAGASAAKPSGKDAELEKKKKEKETADAAKEASRKKVEDEKQTKIAAENCTRAKNLKATFDLGTRMSKANSSGEREFMDETQRASEVKRLEGIIASECNPAKK